MFVRKIDHSRGETCQRTVAPYPTPPPLNSPPLHAPCSWYLTFHVHMCWASEKELTFAVLDRTSLHFNEWRSTRFPAIHRRWISTRARSFSLSCTAPAPRPRGPLWQTTVNCKGPVLLQRFCKMFSNVMDFFYFDWSDINPGSFNFLQLQLHQHNVNCCRYPNRYLTSELGKVYRKKAHLVGGAVVNYLLLFSNFNQRSINTDCL